MHNGVGACAGALPLLQRLRTVRCERPSVGAYHTSYSTRTLAALRPVLHTRAHSLRHFGGIKLGSGGLVRAYGGAARDCLRSAPKQFVARRVRLRAEAPFQSLGAVYAAMQRHGAAPCGAEEYTESGLAAVTFVVDAVAAAAAVEAVSDATSGRVVPRLADDAAAVENE